MTFNDYGTPTDTLASPSLSEWAAAVAAELGSHPARSGGLLHATSSVASSTAGNNTLAVAGTPTTWGGVGTSGNTLTVSEAGLYRISVNGTFGTSGVGTIRGLWVWLGTGGVPAGQYLIGQANPPAANTSGIGLALSAAGVWNLAAGNGLQLVARQDSGGSLTCSATLTVQLIH